MINDITLAIYTIHVQMLKIHSDAVQNIYVHCACIANVSVHNCKTIYFGCFCHSHNVWFDPYQDSYKQGAFYGSVVVWLVASDGIKNKHLLPTISLFKQ